MHHGELVVELASDEMHIEEMASSIAQAARPVLVLTTSHDMTTKLGAHLPDAAARGKGEPLADAVERCADDGILIAAGAWSGLDSPRLRWKTVVIPKTPYGAPTVLDGQHVNRYIDSKVVAIRRTYQVPAPWAENPGRALYAAVARPTKRTRRVAGGYSGALPHRLGKF